MKTKTLFAILAGLFVVAVVSVGLLAANDDNPGRGRKPDKQNPVHATDIELVKKITIKGKPSWAQGGGGGKKKEVAATGALGTTVGTSGTRYAVVVGISDYPGTNNDLEYCDDDADVLYDALTTVYGFSDINITLLKDGFATSGAIITAIESIGASASEGDEVVFFFSGHGARGIADDGDKERIDEAIVAHDGTNIVPIWDGELADAFSEFATTRIIFIFDTCLAGGMAEDLEEPGRVIAMACGENGYSYEIQLDPEDPEIGNGEFTHYFVDLGIFQGNAHVEEHEYDEVTVEEAYDYAKANCTLDRPTISDEFENDLLP